MKPGSRNIMFAATLYVALGIPTFAQKDPSKTNDVLDGKRFLLRTDDIARSYIISQTGQVGLSTVVMQSKNGYISQSIPTRVVTTASSVSPDDAGGGVALARLYNAGNDVQVTLSPGNYWIVQLVNTVTGNFQQFQLQQDTYPSFGNVHAQIMVGDFNGDGYDDVVLAYSSESIDYSQSPPHVVYNFAMRIGTAVDVNKVDSGLQFGPEWRYPYDSNNPNQGRPFARAIAKTLAIGDFNGDGRSDLAALLSDNQTIQFFTVDPNTLWFQPKATVQLPDSLNGTGGQLVAGRFRNTSSLSNKPFDELVALGSTDTGPVNVYSIALNPGNNFAIVPTYVTSSALPLASPWNQTARIEAVSGPLAEWASPHNVQLVIAITGSDNDKHTNPFLMIGSFDVNFNYQGQTSSDVHNDSDQCVTSVALGNFDNIQSNTSPPQRNPNLSIALYYTQGNNACSPPLQGNRNFVGVWAVTPLTDGYALFPLPFNYDVPPGAGIQGVSLSVGDTQGRSLRLGQPEVLTITDQIQPDIILSLPPMHVDWIAPGTSSYDKNGINSDCPDETTPCIFNLTALPTPAYSSTNNPFTTGLNFSSSSSSSLKRVEQTSWTMSVKSTVENKISVGIPDIAQVTDDIKNTAQYQHDRQVTKEYNQNTVSTESVNTTTGLADALFYTSRSHYIFLYPVLGRTACPASNTGCSEQQPLYVQFSIPKSKQSSNVDATTQEWYQPLHEPGNVLSYPWTFAQLNKAFHDGVTQLGKPSDCQATDTKKNTYTVSWQSNQGARQTVGTTNQFSDDLSVSVSTQGSIEFFSGGANYSVDTSASTSLHSLNVNTQGLDSSLGSTVQKPGFSQDIFTCCGYAFQNYILGFNSSGNPFQQLTPLDPENNPVQAAQTGPLFVEFLADVNNGVCQNSNVWFEHAYSRPDVGLNHPSRWSWSGSTQQVSFYGPGGGGNVLTQPFYWMKGLFISEQNNTSTSIPGPSLTEAAAGDQLVITARVYNFSMAKASNVHVRIYGQPYCVSNASSEASCTTGPNCTAGSLCGNAFEIGENVIYEIASYQSDVTDNALPNWQLTSIPFDTTKLSGINPNGLNLNLAFWVLTWMEDGNGNVLPEMQDHGMNLQGANAFNPAAVYTDMTQIPIEGHSNNIGLYGAHTPFLVAAKPNLGIGGPQPQGTPEKLSVALAKRRSVLEDNNVVTAKITAGTSPIHSLIVEYFDGNPEAGGKLFDIQRIPFAEANSTVTHQTLYRPQSCGTHSIYTVATASGSSSITEHVRTRVVADTSKIIDDLISQTKRLDLPFRVAERLAFLLTLASDAYEKNNEQVGKELLDRYWTILQRYIDHVPAANADKLKGEIGVLEVCNPLRTPGSQMPNASASQSEQEVALP